MRGRPVAQLVPLDQPGRRIDVDVATIRAVFAETPIDDQFSSDLAQMRRNEQPVDDPWQRA